MTDDDPTFDLELPDASLDDFSYTLSGLTLLYQQILEAHAHTHLDYKAEAMEVSDLLRRVMAANREATRELFLGDEEAQLYVEDEAFLEDELGLKVVGGEVVDAEAYDKDFTDIEVE